jgi:hypothetical protein
MEESGPLKFSSCIIDWPAALVYLPYADVPRSALAGAA